MVMAKPPETKIPEIPEANPRLRSNHLAIIVRDAIVSIPCPLKRSSVKPTVKATSAAHVVRAPVTRAIALATDSI